MVKLSLWKKRIPLWLRWGPHSLPGWSRRPGPQSGTSRAWSRQVWEVAGLQPLASQLWPASPRSKSSTGECQAHFLPKCQTSLIYFHEKFPTRVTTGALLEGFEGFLVLLEVEAGDSEAQEGNRVPGLQFHSSGSIPLGLFKSLKFEEGVSSAREVLAACVIIANRFCVELKNHKILKI